MDNKPQAQVFHLDLYGKRETKYDFLNEKSINSIDWNELSPVEPYNFFVPKNFNNANEYENGFMIEDIYLHNNTGIQTKRDGLVYQFNTNAIKTVIEDVIELPNQAIQRKYNLPEDGRDWTIDFAKKDLAKRDGMITEISYHPFDTRMTYFTGRSKGFMAYPRSPLSNHCLHKNISLLFVRNSRNDKITNFFIANKLVDKDGISPLDNCKFFPLYLYPESSGQQSNEQATTPAPPEEGNKTKGNSNLEGNMTMDRIPNLNMEIVNKIAVKLSLKFTPEKFPSSGGVSEGRGGGCSFPASEVQDGGCSLKGSSELSELKPTTPAPPEVNHVA
jgi:predicted helicase